MDYRIGIQILSYNKPKYLAQTLHSLMRCKGTRDKIIVFEQSDSDELRKEGLALCKEYSDVQVILSQENLGQRGATNKVIESGFFDNCQYVMLTDHDNLFHEPLDIYVDKLSSDASIWVATGYNSPEHDIEDKSGDWLLKTTARAGHMVLRQEDFMSLTPLDEQAGIAQGCAWFAGLDWLITHWHPKSPGMKRAKIIAAYPGGVEHIGRESTWQGKYDDEYTVEENLRFRELPFDQILEFYKPRHTYQDGKYWYEKDPPKTIIESTPSSTDDRIKKLFMDSFNKELASDEVDVISQFMKIDDVPSVIESPETEVVEDFIGTGIVAFNYIWPSYGDVFLEQSIKSILDHVDQYVIYLTKYSYIGVECDPLLYQRVKDVCSAIDSHKIKLIEITDKHECSLAKDDNIRFYFKKVVNLYMDDNNVKYVWLVQSDELYDSKMCDSILQVCNSGEIEHCLVIDVECYFGSPHWIVDPNENIERPTIVRKHSKLDYNNKVFRKDLAFKHYSYVLTTDEVKCKFQNWGHRNDVNRERFFETFDNVKSNKNLRGLHPIHPPLYASIKFDDSQLSNDNFVFWIKSNCNTINDTIQFIHDELVSSTQLTCYYTNIDDLSLSTLKSESTIALVNDYDMYLDINKHTNHITHFGSLIKGLQFIDAESLGLFVYHLDNVDHLKDDLINIYSKLADFGWGCVIYRTEQLIEDKLKEILVRGEVKDSDEQRFMFNFHELNTSLIECGEYSICLFRTNLVNPFSTITSDKVIFGPFIGEFGWEVSKWAPAVNKFINDNPNVDVIVATDQDSFKLYYGASNYYHVSSPAATKDCFDNSSINKNILDHLISDIDGTFPGYEIVNPTTFNNALNIFPFKDMSLTYEFNSELMQFITSLIKDKGDRIPIAISCRHIEDKPRNWNEDNWSEFYKLINESDEYIGLIVGDSSGKNHGLTNVLYMSSLFANSEYTKSEIALSVMKIAKVTVGQQSSLPILSQYVGTPTLMFGHRKYRNMNFDNPLGVQKMFIENHNYDIEPVELFNQLKRFIRRIRI